MYGIHVRVGASKKRTKFSEPRAAAAKPHAVSLGRRRVVDNMALGPRVSLSRAFAEGVFQTSISLRTFKLYLSAHCRVDTCRKMQHPHPHPPNNEELGLGI